MSATGSTADDKGKHVFLFVNPTSGGNAGFAFTGSGMSQASFSDPKVEFFLADIREGSSGAKPGFLKLKALLDDSSRLGTDEDVRVVAAGGDGTVMWCASEMWAHGIDDPRVVIGVVPYGTGNDFARALKWNGQDATQPFEQQMKSLRRLCNLWISSPVVYHDVWEIEIQLFPDGCFKQIDSKTRKKKLLVNSEDARLSQKVFKMNNYFSIGVESRIGIGFDRHRRTTAAGNKMVYLNEGFKKMLFKKTAPIDKLVANMTTNSDEKNDVVFTTEASSHTKLKPAMSLIASNIPSFASGADIWRSCAGKSLGVEPAPDKELSHTPQLMGDGKLEFLSFSSAFSLGMEQVSSGHGHRIHQGQGPFTLNFKPLAEGVRVYYQVDGEFFVMTCPKHIQISLYKQLKVIANTGGGEVDTSRFISAAPDSTRSFGG